MTYDSRLSSLTLFTLKFVQEVARFVTSHFFGKKMGVAMGVYKGTKSR